MGGDARSDSNIRYKRLLQLLSKHIPTLCFSKNGDPDTVFSLFIEPWFHASALAKTSNQTRLDAVEQELSQLQGLLGNIQAEFLLHLSQQQQANGLLTKNLEDRMEPLDICRYSPAGGGEQAATRMDRERFFSAGSAESICEMGEPQLCCETGCNQMADHWAAMSMGQEGARDDDLIDEGDNQQTESRSWSSQAPSATSHEMITNYQLKHDTGELHLSPLKGVLQIPEDAMDLLVQASNLVATNSPPAHCNSQEKVTHVLLGGMDGLLSHPIVISNISIDGFLCEED